MPAEAIGTISTIEEPQVIKESEPLETRGLDDTSPKPPGPAVLDLSEIEDLQALPDSEPVIVLEAVPEQPATPSSQTAAVEFEFEFSLEKDSSHQDELTPNEVTVPHDSIPPQEVQREAFPAETQNNTDIDSPVSRVLPHESPPEADTTPAAVPASDLKVSALSEIETDVEVLFAQATDDLRRTQANREFELAVETIRGGQNEEHVAILFDLAADALRNPQSAAQYVDSPELQPTEVIASPEVYQQLRRAEEETRRSALSLTHQSSAQASTSRASRSQHKPEAHTASGWLCLKRLIGEASIFLLLSAIIGCARFSATFLGDHALSPAHTMAILLWWLTAAILLLPVYQALIVLITGDTVARAASGTIVVTTDGRVARFEHYLLRNLCFPLSLVSAGWLPALFGRRALHDLVAGTRVVVEKP